MAKFAAAAGDDQSYWWRWQVPVCGLLILLPAVASLFLISKKNSGGPKTSSHHLWLPRWKSIHPKWLLIYRALAFLAMAFLLYQTVLRLGFFAFFFYTQWTFALVGIYFALGTIISAHGCWIHSIKSPELSEEDEKLIKSQQLGFWGILMERIYQACAGAVMLTDIVFWCLLVPFMLGEEFQMTMLIAFMHSVNAVFLILDSVLNSIPFTWFGMVYFVLWSCCYVVFQWAIHICCVSWWPYPFLDLSNAWAPMWYLALALVHVPCYGIYIAVVKGKDWISSKMCSASPNARSSSDKKLS